MRPEKSFQPKTSLKAMSLTLRVDLNPTVRREFLRFRIFKLTTASSFYY